MITIRGVTIPNRASLVLVGTGCFVLGYVKALQDTPEIIARLDAIYDVLVANAPQPESEEEVAEREAKESAIEGTWHEVPPRQIEEALRRADT